MKPCNSFRTKHAARVDLSLLHKKLCVIFLHIHELSFETQPILPLWWGGQVNSCGSHVTKHEQAEREGHSFNHVGESNG